MIDMNLKHNIKNIDIDLAKDIVKDPVIVLLIVSVLQKD